MRTNLLFIILAMAFIFLFTSCSALLKIIGPGDKRKGVVYIETLQKVESDYRIQVSWPDLTAPEKQLLKGKSAVLTNALYGGKDLVGLVDESKMLPEELLNRLFRYLNDLQRGALRPIPGSQALNAQALYAQDAQSQWTNREIQKALTDAGLVSEYQAQMDPLLLGTLIELFRTSLHFAMTVIDMRNASEEIIESRWMNASAWMKAYDVASLPKVAYFKDKESLAYSRRCIERAVGSMSLF